MDNARPRSNAPLRTMLSAFLALLVVVAGTAVYPHLIAAAVSPVMLTVLRVAIGLCAIAVVVLPVAALVRRLVR